MHFDGIDCFEYFRGPNLEATSKMSLHRFSRKKVHFFYVEKCPIFFGPKFFQKKSSKFFGIEKIVFFFGVEKKSWGIASMQKFEIFRFMGFSEWFRHSYLCFGTHFYHNNFKFWSQNHGFWWNLLFWAL